MKGQILLFHEVNNAKWFEQVVIFLKSRYEMVDLDRMEPLLKEGKSIKGLCHITFDDGDKSFYDIIFPVLKKHEVPATLFVSPRILMENDNYWFQEVRGYKHDVMIGLLAESLGLDPKQIQGENFRYLLKCLPVSKIHEIISLYQEKTGTEKKAPQNISVEELIELDKSGLITLGGHTINHPVLMNESDADAEKEICGSIKMMEEILGHKTKYFAYPNGLPGLDFGQREMDLLKECGMQLGFAADYRHISKKDNIYSFPRIGISGGSIRFLKLKLMLGKHFESIKNLKRPPEEKERRRIQKILNT